MIFFGCIIVILTFAAIIKKMEARMVLFAAGFIMCIAGGTTFAAIEVFCQNNGSQFTCSNNLYRHGLLLCHETDRM